MISFKSLLSQIIDEVAHKFGVNKEQLGQIASRPDMTTNTGADVGTNIQETLARIVRPQILRGLDVKATIPPSMNVTITPGYGSAQGKVCEIISEQQVAIQNLYGIYYVLLDGSRIKVNTVYDSGLALAKIVIPNPEVTNKILDDKNPESEYDGYIVSGKDLLFNNDFIIDDESYAQLKNIMNKVMAEYIYGTIKLNESLQIANEQGTLKADSDSVNFYDINGNELASYGAYEARVGNIKVTPSTIQSRDFQEGAHGFRLKDNGDAEFDNVTARGTIHASAGTIDGDLTVGGSLSSPNFVSGYAGQGWKIDGDGTATFENGIFRGELHTSVFVKDEIHATNGDLLVTNATVLASGVLTGDTRVYVKESPFSANTVARLKNETNSEYMLISGSITGGYNVVRNLDGTGANTWQAGEAIVGMTSRVSLVASGDTAANLPYIDIIKRNSNTYNNETTKVRLGNLSGISDANFGTLFDYGLYTNNGYFSGLLKASNISGGTISGTSSSIGTTARFIQTPDNIIAYDASSNEVFKINITGADSGDVFIGNVSDQKYLKWDNSANTFNIIVASGTNTSKVSLGGNDIYNYWPISITSGAIKFYNNSAQDCGEIGHVGSGISLNISGQTALNLGSAGSVNINGAASGAEFTVNDYSYDFDTRIEGNTDANLLFCDASTDRVGIGTNVPGAKLDVNGTFICTTIDTGLGATEVYLMNQHVRNSDTVAFGNLGLGDTTPQSTLIVVGGACIGSDLAIDLNNLYVVGNCSVASLTDRTPYFEGDAIAEISKIRSKEGKIDHSTLPLFAQKTIKVNHEDKVERDIGAMVSIFTVAIQQLTTEIDTLKQQVKDLMEKPQ